MRSPHLFSECLKEKTAYRKSLGGINNNLLLVIISIFHYISKEI